MNNQCRYNPRDEELRALLRSLPDMEPDPDFHARLMRRLPQRQPSLLLRFRLWATRPRTLTFTPVRIAPVLALAVAAVLLLPHFLPTPRSGVTDSGVAEYAGTSVRFVLADKHRGLHSVAVLGSFNNWRPTGFEMRYDASAGAWVLTTELPQGSHEYVFLVNGAQTLPDPDAPFSKDDGFGQRNSLLMVEGSHAL
ncbi:MAG: glycoside hydrolase family 13 [Desulfovibrio sp.]